MAFRQHSAQAIEDFWAEVDAIEKGAQTTNIPFPMRTIEELDAQRPVRKIPPVTAPRKDSVNVPQHYARYKHEPIHFLVENGANPFQFNIVKYVMRAEHKHETPFEDCKKVLRYAEMYLKFLSGDKDWWKPSTMVIEGYFP